MFLIDFEYAADNNPLFDLASFLSENDIEDEKTRRHFLKFYFNKRCDDKIYRRIVRLMALQDILWYYWAQMHYISSKQLVYKRIAHHKWKTIMKNASSQWPSVLIIDLLNTQTERIRRIYLRRL